MGVLSTPMEILLRLDIFALYVWHTQERTSIFETDVHILLARESSTYRYRGEACRKRLNVEIV